MHWNQATATARPLLEHLNEISRQLADAEGLLLLCDFDGSLTPIVDAPHQARLAPVAQRLIDQLANKARTTFGIVTGRELADIRTRVGLRGVVYAANHGLQIEARGFSFMDSIALAKQPLLAKVAGQLGKSLAAIPGALVEFKQLSLAVHFRRVPPELHERVRYCVKFAVAAARCPLLLSRGKMVYEISPHGAWSKASAVRFLRAVYGPSALVVYVGDDLGDEPAFAAVDGGISIKVGSAFDTCAGFYVPSTRSVLRFLAWLNGRTWGFCDGR